MGKVLCVIDDARIRQSLTGLLISAGFEPFFAGSQDPLLAILAEHPSSLALVDTTDNTPETLRICTMLRRVSDIPILLLIRIDCQSSFLTYLEAGASDCVTKPIRAQELVARIQAAVRRKTGMLVVEPRQMLRYADLTVEVRNRRVLRSGSELSIGPIGFRLLVFFVEHVGEVFSRQELLQRVWGYPQALGDTNLVDTAIRRLREDLGDSPKESKYIHTVRGIGYRFEVGSE